MGLVYSYKEYIKRRYTMQITFDTRYIKSYSTIKNLKKAVEKFEECRYVVSVTEEGRFYPIFIGEEALQAGVHFHNFPVTN